MCVVIQILHNVYNYTLCNICITTAYMRLSIHEPYLQLLCVRIYMNDPQDSRGSVPMLID